MCVLLMHKANVMLFCTFCWLQILGPEARSRVPEEYIEQDPSSANPPTLFLVLAQMADQIATQSSSSDSDAKTAGAFDHQEQFLRAG